MPSVVTCLRNSDVNIIDAKNPQFSPSSNVTYVILIKAEINASYLLNIKTLLCFGWSINSVTVFALSNAVIVSQILVVLNIFRLSILKDYDYYTYHIYISQ